MAQQSLANGVVTTYSYTPEKGLLSGVVTTPLSGQGLSLAYTRDSKGRITAVDSSLAAEDWSYSSVPAYGGAPSTSTKTPVPTR